jgi:hypothetical protein
MHALDVYWLLAPAGGGVSPADLGPFFGMGAVAALAVRWRTAGQVPLSTSDPELARSLGYESP